MAYQELINYIKEQVNAGLNKNDIKQALLGVGWQEKDIEDAFGELNKKVQEPTKQKPVEEEVGEEEIKLPPENIIDLKDKGFKPEENLKEIKFVSPESFIPKTISNVVAVKPSESRPNQILSDKNQINLKPVNKTLEPQQVKIVSATSNHKKFKIILYVLVGLSFVGMLGLITFLYIQNNNLENKLVVFDSQQRDSGGQIQNLTKTINILQEEVSTLKRDNNNLLNEKNDLLSQVLLFSPATSSLEIEFNAIPIKEGNQYLLKTSQNILVVVKNPTELVKRILDNFLNQNIEVGGIRVPGRRELTITVINKESLEKWEEKIISQTTTTQTSVTSSNESGPGDESQ